MAERQQVHAEESSNDKSPEPQMSRSQTRFKASNMSFVEMVEMVGILKRADYDGKHGPYPNPNVRKAKIMAKVVKSLQKNFGGMAIQGSTEEMMVRLEIEGAGSVQKDQETASKKFVSKVILHSKHH
ncbi:hypothetical protein AB205_0197600 [Aquarana catesbeiana]|uniref:Uncharacterized protein n=1 Tax=Aquarana catesbeiana TaxID=8400 RepID=A0A2G9R433_AQUCT|nr:hypothetical protein AB205_0197600 [Aquarana catesbeiana]